MALMINARCEYGYIKAHNSLAISYESAAASLLEIEIFVYEDWLFRVGV